MTAPMSISAAPKLGLTYLATPYTKYPGGIEAAFIEASRIAAQLMKAGIKIYSPIAHCHPLAIHGGLDPLDADVWIAFDEAMLSACDTLIVAQMPTWHTSRGVLHEIKFFREVNRPIFYLDPMTLLMSRRPDFAGAAA